MAKLTKYEKETIILFSEGENTAHIQTYNAGLRNRLAAFSRKYPDLCRLEKTYAQGVVSYVLDKSRLSIRLQPPYSEERGRKASDNAKQNGFNSQRESCSVPGCYAVKMSSLYPAFCLQLHEPISGIQKKIPIFSCWRVFPNGGFSAKMKLWIVLPNPGTYVLRRKP